MKPAQRRGEIFLYYYSSLSLELIIKWVTIGVLNRKHEKKVSIKNWDCIRKVKKPQQRLLKSTKRGKKLIRTLISNKLHHSVNSNNCVVGFFVFAKKSDFYFRKLFFIESLQMHFSLLFASLWLVQEVRTPGRSQMKKVTIWAISFLVSGKYPWNTHD